MKKNNNENGTNRKQSDEEQIEYVECPFCKERDFDLPGLKLHLYKYCDVFKETEDI